MKRHFHVISQGVEGYVPDEVYCLPWATLELAHDLWADEVQFQFDRLCLEDHDVMFGEENGLPFVLIDDRWSIGVCEVTSCDALPVPGAQEERGE